MLFGHSQRLYAAMPIIRQMRPAYWKAIDPDPASASECLQLGVKLIVRHAGAWDQDAAVFNAQTFFTNCKAQSWFPFCWAIETPNEPFSGQLVPLSYAQQETTLVKLLHSVGRECVVNNRGTGQDGHFVTGATYYGAHEYGWPRLWSQAGDHLQRYRTWFPTVLKRNPKAKLLITECGITHAVVGGPDLGYRSEGGADSETYVKGLLAYASELQTDGYALGAFVFQIGGYSDWRTFEILGDDIILQQLIQQANGGDQVAQFLLGIKAKADELTGKGIDVGEPLADEQAIHAVPGGTQIAAYQMTSMGMFWYDAAANVVHFFAAAR